MPAAYEFKQFERIALKKGLRESDLKWSYGGKE